MLIKRVSRLAANIPPIRHNRSPLSFDEGPKDTYTEAILGVYELNRTALLRDVFCRAYERSAARYAAVRQSPGEPDPFRMRHRSALRELVATVIRERMNKKEAASHIGLRARKMYAGDDDFVLGDGRVRALVARATNRRSISPARVEVLVRVCAHERALSPRYLCWRIRSEDEPAPSRPADPHHPPSMGISW